MEPIAVGLLGVVVLMGALFVLRMPVAFAMAAAASLTPEGEASLYAKARDASAIARKA